MGEQGCHRRVLASVERPLVLPDHDRVPPPVRIRQRGHQSRGLRAPCASQAIGTLSAEQAHEAAIQRMACLFAAVEDTDAFVAKVRAFQPAAG
jgi:hypothetical protein